MAQQAGPCKRKCNRMITEQPCPVQGNVALLEQLAAPWKDLLSEASKAAPPLVISVDSGERMHGQSVL